MNLESKQLTRYRKGPENRERNEEYERHLRIYQHAAETKGIRPITSGVWCKADGVRYRSHGQEYSVVLNTDGETLPPSRLEAVGTYDDNNGLVAYVNEHGELWVGRTTEENFHALAEAGYRNNSVSVPFSNGERIIDDTDRAAFIDTRTGKHKEALHTERVHTVRKIQELYAELFGTSAKTPHAEQLLQEQRERPKLPDTHIVIDKYLAPRAEHDSHSRDITHTIYSFKKATFAFQQPDQLCENPTSEGARTELLAPQFRVIPQDEALAYTERLAHTSETKRHFATVGSLHGIIELVSKLDPQNTEYAVLLSEIRAGVFSPRALRLADAYIALQHGSTTHPELYSYQEAHAPAALVLALLGEPTAQHIIVERIRQMDAHDAKEKNKQRDAVDAEPLHTDKLLVTHATKYKPEETADGFCVPTTYDAGHGQFLRNTIHTALNHRVAEHGYGSWDDAQYTLLSPFTEMTTHNGIPRTLNTVDTYWTRNPGEKLQFPHAVLVGPGAGNQHELIRIDGRKVLYKPHLGLRDVPALLEKTSSDRQRKNIESRLRATLCNEYATGMTSLDAMRAQWDVEKVCRHFNALFTSSGDNNPVIELFQKTQPRSAFALARELIRDPQLSTHYTGAPDAYELNCDRYATLLSTRISEILRQTLNTIAVDDTIQQLGYAVQSGGMWAWGDSWEVTAQTRALARDLQTISAPHHAMPEHKLTDAVATIQYRISEARKHGESATSLVDLSEFIPKVDPATRRMIACSGYLYTPPFQPQTKA